MKSLADRLRDAMVELDALPMHLPVTPETVQRRAWLEFYKRLTDIRQAVNGVIRDLPTNGTRPR